MSDDLDRTAKLVSATLRLRTAFSNAPLALAEIEGATSLEDARMKARAARLGRHSVQDGRMPRVNERVVTSFERSEAPIDAPVHPIIG